MTERKIYLLVVLLFSVIVKNFGNNKPDNRFAESYITGFSELAISEMNRSGIPASIILAQGMLESDFGQSELATRYNNHFGIKCHKGWTGKSVQLKTTEHSREGYKKENHCFRAYLTPVESYTDHTDFLSNRENYQFLIHSGNLNYKFWAQGLQKAKYATDPAYAKKIIELIEQYNLQNLDSKNNKLIYSDKIQKAEIKIEAATLSDSKLKILEQKLNHIIQFQNELYEIQNQMKKELRDFISNSNEKNNSVNSKLREIDTIVKNSGSSIRLLQDDLNAISNKKIQKNSKELFYPPQHLNASAIFYLNGKMATILDSEHDLKDIATAFKISFNNLLKYNDLTANSQKWPNEGYYIFLEKKATKVKHPVNVHVVDENETMHYLSQRYGVKLDCLYRMNKMHPGEEPITGEFIFLDCKVKTKPSIKSNNKN